MPTSSKRFVVRDDVPEPARKLAKLISNETRQSIASVRKIIQEGGVRVNRQVCYKPYLILQSGDQIEVFPIEKKARLAKVKSIRFPRQLTVIYEDSQLLVVDKPAGLLSVPAKKGDRKTLLSLVERYLKESDSDAAVFSLQRLDRDVSGVMLFAKDQSSYLNLRRQFEENKPGRKYVAIVAGQVKKDEGTFRSFLTTGKNLTRYSVKDEKKGELAITHFKVIRRLPKETVVEVTLETGRRNQIRVQFAEAGHPVIGETRYQRWKAVRPDWDSTQIALHANTLSLVHPVLGKKVEFCSPWPPAFKRFLQRNSNEKPKPNQKSETTHEPMKATENKQDRSNNLRKPATRPESRDDQSRGEKLPKNVWKNAALRRKKISGEGKTSRPDGR